MFHKYLRLQLRKANLIENPKNRLVDNIQKAVLIMSLGHVL